MVSRLAVVALGVGAALVLAMLPADAAAPANANLLVNPHLDLGLDGWSGGEWDPAPSPGTAGSGVLKLVSGNPYEGSTGVYAAQCVDGVGAGNPYRLAARVYLAQGQPRRPNAQIYLWEYEEGGCTGAVAVNPLGPFALAEPGPWQAIGDTGWLSPRTRSVQVALMVVRSPVLPGEQAADAVVGYFDDAEFWPAFITRAIGLQRN